MSKVRRVTQLEFEGFAISTAEAEEAEGGKLLSVADVRAKEILVKTLLISQGKIGEDDEIPSWADVYHQLLSVGVRGRIAAYVAWATMPKKYRWPDTQEKLATEVLGLNSDRVISTWRKRFPEIDMMIADLQSEAMLEYRPGAFHALGMVASDPSYRANPDRKLFFEMTQDYTPRIKTEEVDGRAGKKLLDQLKKLTSAQLVEALGSEAHELMQELEEELDEDLQKDSKNNPAEGETE